MCEPPRCDEWQIEFVDYYDSDDPVALAIIAAENERIDQRVKDLAAIPDRYIAADPNDAEAVECAATASLLYKIENPTIFDYVWRHPVVQQAITDEQSDADAKTIADYIEANEKERRRVEANALDAALGAGE